MFSATLSAETNSDGTRGQGTAERTSRISAKKLNKTWLCLPFTVNAVSQRTGSQDHQSARFHRGAYANSTRHCQGRNVTPRIGDEHWHGIFNVRMSETHNTGYRTRARSRQEPEIGAVSTQEGIQPMCVLSPYLSLWRRHYHSKASPLPLSSETFRFWVA